MRRSCLLMIILLALATRGRAKTSTRDELRSDLRSALSLASETDLFIGQVESGRLLPRFQTGHADYLRAEAQRHAKEARDAENTSENGKRFALCAEQLDLLSEELRSLRMHTDVESLGKARRRVESIREILIAAGAAR